MALNQKCLLDQHTTSCVQSTRHWYNSAWSRRATTTYYALTRQLPLSWHALPVPVSVRLYPRQALIPGRQGESPLLQRYAARSNGPLRNSAQRPCWAACDGHTVDCVTHVCLSGQSHHTPEECFVQSLSMFDSTINSYDSYDTILKPPGATSPVPGAVRPEHPQDDAE